MADGRARIVIEGWRQHYNRVRPRSSLNDFRSLAFSLLRHAALPISNRAISEETAVGNCWCM
jgi:hypothetical protein